MPERPEVSICWATKSQQQFVLGLPRLLERTLLLYICQSSINNSGASRTTVTILMAFRYFVWKYFCWTTKKLVEKGANWILEDKQMVNDGWEGLWERKKDYLANRNCVITFWFTALCSFHFHRIRNIFILFLDFICVVISRLSLFPWK